ncbi:MAG: ABC transporter substrate-binding protein [Acetivibrionales bacterium]|jgi:multiple sugar transport system substrate-binding protein
MVTRKASKALVLFIAVIFLFSALVGCGSKPAAPSSGENQKSEGSQTSGTASEAADQSVPKPTDPFDYSTAKIDWRQKEGSTIRLMFSKHYFTDGIQTLLPEFEELTGIKAQFEVFPESEFWNKMLIEFNAGSNPPDAFMLNYNVVSQYHEGGWVEPLQKYIDDPNLTDPEWYDFDDFMTTAIDFGTYADTFYGFPVTGEWQVLFYRKDLYEEKGLKVPETMEELYNNAKALNGDGISGIVNRCARASAAFWPWGGFVRTYGGYWVSPDGEVQLTSDPVVKATDMYVKLLKDCGPTGVVNYTWYEALTDFQQGKAAHFIDSSGFMELLENPEKSAVAGKVGYALMPSAESGKNAVPNVNHWMLGMGKQSKNKEAAYLFLQWATSKKVGKVIAINNGTAARNSLWTDPEFVGKYPEDWVKVSIDSSPISDKLAIPQIKETGEIGEYLEIALNEIYGGNKTVAEALKEAEDKTKKALGK